MNSELAACALFVVQFILNTALCQSPPGISKTQKAIDYIRHFSIASRFNNGAAESGTHHITVVLTNNNLSETKQWRIRLSSKLSGLNALILSSKKGADSINSMDQLWGKISRSKNASNLPDLIVMCTHEKRTGDLVELIDTLKLRRHDLSGIGIRRITLTIMFDEADKNMKLISQCLKDIDPLLNFSEGDEKKDNILRDVHFITATPFKEFWKMLPPGVKKLKNINSSLKAMDENSQLHTDYKLLMDDYRWLSEHHLNTSLEDSTMIPKEYVEKVLPAAQGPVTLFAPAAIEITSHLEMKDMLIKKGYTVYVDDSANKGFFDPSGKFTSLEKFNTDNKVKGELYNTFVEWRRLNPEAPIALTGYLNVIRGITFNTVGFNFTHMIISAYHAKDLANLIQLLGRANGGKKYVGKMNIICPKTLWDKANDAIKIMKELHEKSPEEFEEKDFRRKTKRDEQEPAWTVPDVIHLGEERFANIKKKGKSKVWDKDTIFAELTKDDAALVADIQARECFQCTMPEKDDTYKKYVTDFMTKATEKRKFNMGLHKDDKKKDGYQMFLDCKGFNVIVSRYNGTLIVEDVEPATEIVDTP